MHHACCNATNYKLQQGKYKVYVDLLEINFKQQIYRGLHSQRTNSRSEFAYLDKLDNYDVPTNRHRHHAFWSLTIT